MMRVTIEIVPFGSEEDKHTISEINIWNTGEASGDQGYYRYLYSRATNEEIQAWLPDERSARADGEVFHRRELGAEHLAAMVLEKIC